jgi:hypothetical protein
MTVGRAYPTVFVIRLPRVGRHRKSCRLGFGRQAPTTLGASQFQHRGAPAAAMRWENNESGVGPLRRRRDGIDRSGNRADRRLGACNNLKNRANIGLNGY